MTKANIIKWFATAVSVLAAGIAAVFPKFAPYIIPMSTFLLGAVVRNAVDKQPLSAQNAQSQQATNEAAATANLQEQQQNKQMQISALGAAQQGYGAQAGAYGAAGSQAGALNAADTGLQAQNASAAIGAYGQYASAFTNNNYGFVMPP